MDSATFFTGLGVIVSASSAIVAVIAVVDARSSRKEAADSATEAGTDARKAAESAQKTAEASTRAAAALEVRNARAAREDAARIPWLVQKLSPERWRVTNETGMRAEFVQLVANGIRFQMEDDRDFRDVERGNPIFINFGGGLTDPASADIVISWTDATRDSKSFTITLG
ncbi:hypothetical protein K2F54_15380 [Cryobacterium sp. 1639]|uniref:hypothetical protein n=1 Tax=Cryobacterium inferilacus TaxID=2866629 RepID=UPI001C7369B5|nr:hypothetical protein [Cryobacterium sp. 1639]MBX0301355.1 hypothetical protein [Cryobacterium sp. 1639]